MTTSKYVRHGLAGVAALAAVGLLTACAGGAAPAADDAAEGPVTVTLANSQWLDATRGEGLWDAVAGYADASENDVERVEYPSSEIATRLTTELGAGEGPDVMFIQDNVFESFVDAGFLAPLDDTVEGVELNSTNEGGVKDGVRYGVAWQRAPFALLYNADILAEAGVEVPTTPEELIEAAQTITEETGIAGFGDQTPAAGDGRWLQAVNTWTYGAGGSWATEDGTLTIDSPENIEGVEIVKELADSGILSPDNFQTNRALFSQGQLAMMSEIGGGAIVAALEGVVDPAAIGVAPNPMPLPGYHQQLYVVVNANSPHVDAARDFVSWLVSEEGQERLRDASGSDPLATDVPISDDYAAENPWAEGFLEIGSTTRSTLIPGHEMQTTEIMTIIMDHVQSVVVSDVSPADALAAAQAEAEALAG